MELVKIDSRRTIDIVAKFLNEDGFKDELVMQRLVNYDVE